MLTRRQSLVLLGAILGISRSDASQGMSHERGIMGTKFIISCYHPDSILVGAAMAAAFREAEQVDFVASDYVADSELLSIGNIPFGTPVKISPLLFDLLSSARHLAEITDGWFDPTVGPLTKLWRESRRRKRLPDPETLLKAKGSVGWKDLILDDKERTAMFSKPGMRLDLGGIAKGQAADRMLEVLMNHGISRCSVTAGGDVRVGDAPPGKVKWSIGVRHLDIHENTEELNLANQAVSTSGNLRQFVEIDGTRYSHIVDPFTGLGMTRNSAVTVIAENAAVSDALATASCVAGKEKSLGWISSHAVKAFFSEE